MCLLLSFHLLWLVIPHPSCSSTPPYAAPSPVSSCPLTEGLHPPSDPWGSAGSMVQPGYPSMLGNSTHLSQHAPFTAINPQDRLVSIPSYDLDLLISIFDAFFFWVGGHICLLWSVEILWSLLHPRNGNRCPSRPKTTPNMAAKWTGTIRPASTLAQTATAFPVKHPPLLVRILWCVNS